jgi:malate dehydrogenase (oxaloacetate-decarboxylating)(NADP+)
MRVYSGHRTLITYQSRTRSPVIQQHCGENNPGNTMSLRKDALHYHAEPTPGKIAIIPTKPCETAHDLALAYSPGVAEPCLEIAKNPAAVYDYTSKGNLVAVISNGTAVLGLGDIGAAAGKPVMEGKGVLFKSFADIDVFDLEVDCKDPEKFVEAVAALGPTFGVLLHRGGAQEAPRHPRVPR